MLNYFGVYVDVDIIFEMVRRLRVRFPFGGINNYLLIFSFLRSGIKAKRSVEFRHSTSIPAESVERSVSILGCLLYYKRYTA